mgnify:FL=1
METNINAKEIIMYEDVDVEWENIDKGYEEYRPSMVCSFQNKLISAFIRVDAEINDRPLYDLFIQVKERTGETLYQIASNQRAYQCLAIVKSIEKTGGKQCYTMNSISL